MKELIRAFYVPLLAGMRAGWEQQKESWRGVIPLWSASVNALMKALPWFLAAFILVACVQFWAFLLVEFPAYTVALSVLLYGTIAAMLVCVFRALVLFLKHTPKL